MYSSITVVIVMVLAIWRGVLAGNLKTGLIRRKPLLVPSLVFIITTIVVLSSVPLPMSVYHGPHQRDFSHITSGRFTVYETIAYDDAQLRFSRSLESNERIEVFANFSLDDVVILSLLLNITPGDLDENYQFSEILGLEPGLYDVEIEHTYYVADTIQDPTFVNILLLQPVDASFLPEVTEWASYQFILGFGLFFLFLGGLCIGREKKSRRSTEFVDQEPPRDERYLTKY
ncbi:MAG: hypothetical protein RTV41_13675 [Candidatus Thorarchaeota archaeon]